MLMNETIPDCELVFLDTKRNMLNFHEASYGPFHIDVEMECVMWC